MPKHTRVTKQTKRVLALAGQDGGVYCADIQEELGLTQQSANALLRRLVGKELLTREDISLVDGGRVTYIYNTL